MNFARLQWCFGSHLEGGRQVVSSEFSKGWNLSMAADGKGMYIYIILYIILYNTPPEV